MTRDLVYKAFAEMDRDATYSTRRRARHVPILMRCDVAGEAQATVAQDLKLSPRQFARERRVAMERFARCAAALSSERMTGSANTDLSKMQRERAARAADAGDRSSALALYLDLARNAADVELRCRALLGAADVEMGEYKLPRCTAYLQDVIRLVAAMPRHSDTRLRLESWLKVFLLRVNIITREPPITGIDGPITAVDLATHNDVDLLVSAAEAALDRGDASKSSRYAQRAREIIGQGSPTSEAAAIDIVALEGGLAYWLHGDAECAASLCQKAGDLAKARGYEGRSMGLTYVADAFRWRSGDGFARARCRSMMDRFQGTVAMPKNLLFATLHCATDFEAVIGDPWRAVTIGSRALDIGANASEQLYISSLIARALARGGRIALARQRAEDVLRRAQSSISGRAILNAMQALADVAIAVRNRREAQERLRNAADLASRFGSASAVAGIHRKLASVSGTQRDRRRANEWSGTLGEAK